jgi:hypothetical protein
MRTWLRDHGLLVVNLALFLLFLAGMTFAGWSTYNQEQLDHGLAPVGLGTFLASGFYGESVFENWESEFLQMGMYVILTAKLFQRGSAESRDPDKAARQDADPRRAKITSATPWPVRRGGLVLRLYEHSLSLMFLVLFAASITLHAVTGSRAYTDDQLAHGLPGATPFEYVATSQFWFESFQNWQSEFLAVALIVVGAVYLRERGSPESKPVAAGHFETGE